MEEEGGQQHSAVDESDSFWIGEVVVLVQILVQGEEEELSLQHAVQPQQPVV